MNSTSIRVTNGIDRASTRKADRFRQAAARRRLQELRDERALRSWLTEVWDEPLSRTEPGASRNFH
jgi:hypothetical protein